MDNQNKKDEKLTAETQDKAKEPVVPSGETAKETEPVSQPMTPAQQEPAVANDSDMEAASDMSSKPTSPTQAPDLGYTETKSSKLVYILVGLLLVILLSLVGLFFYKQMMTVPPESQLSPTPAQVTPTKVVSPTVTPANDEEAELQQIEIPDVDDDLQQIESDINQL